MKKLAWLIFISCCIFFSFQPVKYLIADEPIGLLRSKPLDSTFYLIAFYTHISMGGIALLIGWTQFIKTFREQYKKVHRIIGKVYVISILISGPVAFYIGFFVYGGLVTQIGFTFGAVVWIASTFLAYKKIRQGNIAKHKEYMMYSYAGTCAAITLRLILPPLMMITSFKVAYGISVWASWLPSVLLVYLFIHKKVLLLSIYKKFYLKQVAISLMVLIAISVSLSFTKAHTWFYNKASFEGVSFERVESLNDSYFNEEKIEEILNYLREESETTAMVVLENGKIVLEYGDISEISYTASVRKSILSMLFGKYVDNGSLNLQETIGDFGIDEADGLLPIEKQATIDHILTARSGVFHTAANDGDDPDNIKERGSKKPGEYFVYNNWDFNVAGYILEKTSGNSVEQEIEKQLAIPLGFQDWNIENQWDTEDKEKSRYRAYHMHLSTRDMAKIGQLMLQKGRWNGKQLISEEWIRKTTTTVTSLDTVNARYGFDPSYPMQRSYSYMWWPFGRYYDNPDFDGAYTASGAYGHFITVIPKRNVVIAHKTTRDLLTAAGLSDRTSTPKWRYWWMLRMLMLNRKPIADLEITKSTDQIIEFIKQEIPKDSEYAISERLINEYGLSLAERGKHDEAIKFYELNLELYPKRGYFTHRIYDYYGTSLAALGRKKEALEAFKRSLFYDEENKLILDKIQNLKESN
ncbi:MAG: DUF2306 domain-containing protein [bacterium]